MARSKPPLCGFSCAEISGKEAFAPMNDTFMKTKPVFPLLVSMALPNVISMLVNSLYNIVDSLFVAQINEQAMTALSLVFPIQNFVSAVAIGFGIGINALVALYRGAGDHDRADAAATHGMALSVLHGILCTLAATAIMPGFLARFTTDGTIGVSAGAVFGCNFKSHQIGRVIRYNTEYCDDKRYASFGNLLRTGNLYSEDFCYHIVPEKLDPFDEEAFHASPMDFFVVCTDLRTGEPIYHKCRTGDAEDVRWMEASASMPLAAKAVRIGHYALLDGGVADSIPVRFFESLGYKRNIIILTQPKGFIKKKNPFLPAIRARYLRYPAFVAAVADRHERYNETLSYIAMQESTGRDFVIRPPIPLEIGAMERDPAQLRRVYDTGRAVAENQLDKIEAFLNEVKEMEE